MRYDNKQSEEVEPSVRLQIVKQSQSNEGGDKVTGNIDSTFFEPQRERETPGSNPRNVEQTPEKKLTLFALRLAILEKAASGLGALGFIWATVVLLGGFASMLKKEDFWFITTILLAEGARIFSRSHEMELQHQATWSWSITDAGRYSFRALKSSPRILFRAIKTIFRSLFTTKSRSRGIQQRNQTDRGFRNRYNEQNTTSWTWHSSDVPLLPFAGWVFLSRNVSRILYWLQILSACACVVLSLMRLKAHDFGGEDGLEGWNGSSALSMFYGLALAEAVMFLLEKAYWVWKVHYCKLLEEVNRECCLGNSEMVLIRRFFFDAYSRCMDGSVFDCLKMDMVSFAEELLASDSSYEQLLGASILQKFVSNKLFADETLRKIGSRTPIMERLIEMLNWKNPTEEEIRRSAAQIVSKLAGKKRNALRVAGIPGAMESISSLLHTGRIFNTKDGEIFHQYIGSDQPNKFSDLNLLGLLILKKLARDHDNCYKIGNTRGLLPKIIDFTSGGETLFRDDQVLKIKAVKRTLQVLKMLASSTGKTGKMLRQVISEIVYTVSNIRDILQYGKNHMLLQKLGIEILTSLAMDEDARERIGSTGGIIKRLLGILFNQGLTEAVRIEAGEAVAMLALVNQNNCNQILREELVMERLVCLLSDPVLCINSSRILRNLCAFSANERSFDLRGVVAGAPFVLKAIMVKEEKFQEVSLGLASQICKFLSPEEFAEELKRANIKETSFAEKLVEILKKYKSPSATVPRMRRFVIKLAIWMMECNRKYIEVFSNVGMEEELENVAETTTELECFNVFSGSVGLSRNKTTVSSLVYTALELIAEGRNQSA